MLRCGVQNNGRAGLPVLLVSQFRSWYTKDLALFFLPATCLPSVGAEHARHSLGYGEVVQRRRKEKEGRRWCTNFGIATLVLRTGLLCSGRVPPFAAETPAACFRITVRPVHSKPGRKMALRISFKPGMKQSQQAASYFHDTVGSLVEAMLDGLQERIYRISADDGRCLQLRTWCSKELQEEELHALFEWLLILRADIHGLELGPQAPDDLSQVVGNWLDVRLDGADLFVELAIEHPETGVAELPEFSLGMLSGRSVLVSTNTLLFTWLEDGIFGLSLAGYGSYLLEVEHDARSASGAWRKAS